MWSQLVQGKRGFESSSSGTGDAYRSSPATVPPGSLRLDEAGNPVAKGAPLGKGYETFAAVQLVDADGRRVAVAVDTFSGGGPDAHAEARCVRALERHGPARLPGGKLIVVSDQSVCPSCRRRLVDYARRRRLTVVEPHEPVRPKMVGAGEASPKTTSRSSTQAGRPQLAVVARDPIPVPSTAPPTPGRPPTSPGAPPAQQAPRSGQGSAPLVEPREPRTAPGRPAPPAERGASTRAPVAVTVEMEGRRPVVRVTVAGTAAKDEAPQLSRTPKGSTLATATTAVSIGRMMLDVYGSGADEETRTAIEKITHPVQSRLRSTISDAQKEFLASHPDPSTLVSRIEADELRAVYVAAWRRLGAHRVRATLAAVGLAMVPEDRRGADWDAALEQVLAGQVVPRRDIESFRAAAEAYEDRAIDVLQEIEPYPLGLPQLAGEIDQRARMLETVAEELEEAFWRAATAFPLASTALLRLYSESTFVADLAGRMRGFARTVRRRYRAYVDLDERFSAHLLQVGAHLDNPGRAIMQAPSRASLR